VLIVFSLAPEREYLFPVILHVDDGPAFRLGDIERCHNGFFACSIVPGWQRITCDVCGRGDQEKYRQGWKRRESGQQRTAAYSEKRFVPILTASSRLEFV
jgi:hypothetical protein